MSIDKKKLSSSTSPSQRPVVTEDPVLTGARGSVNFGLKRWLAVIGVATALHEPSYHQQLKSGLENFVINPYKKWQEESALAEAQEEMSKKAQESLEADKKKVLDRTKTPLERIKARAEEAKAFKAKLYTDYKGVPYKNIYFPVEYYGQGTADNEKEAGSVYLELVVDKTQTVDKDPGQADFQKLVSAVMPAGSYERTKSSATLSLCEKLGPESQNCVARTRLVIMAVAQKYPHLQNSLFIQKFGDHQRALVEVNGVRHILEGNVPQFPDAETNAKKNEIMPVEVWLALYSGHKRAEFEDRIESHGPQSKDRKKPADYPRVTDQLVSEDFWDNDLDNVGTAEGWFNSSNGVMGGTEGVDAGTGEDMSGGMSVDGPDPSSTAKKVESLLGSDEKGEKNTSNINEQRPNDTKVYDFDTIDEQAAFNLNREAHQNRLRKISFPHLKKLDAASVKMIISLHPQGNDIYMLEFASLTDLDEAAATELAKFNGQIHFEGFQSLPVHVMKAFSSFRNELTFKTKIASKEALEAFVGPKPGMKITDFFDINTLLPEDADSNFDVSKNEGSVVAPQQFRGGFHLQDTIGLSEDGAEILSGYTGNLTLSRVGLSKAAAQKLSKRANGFIHLNEPTSESFEGFRDHAGNLVVNYGLKDTDDSAKIAKDLAGHKGDLTVSLFSANPRQTFLSVEAAKIWGTRKGNLSLTVGTVSDEALGELATVDGALRVLANGKETLSVETAKKFAQFGIENNHRTLKLDHISGMSAEAASYLIQTKATELHFQSFTTITPEVARYLAQFKGGLYFSNVKSLSLEAARELGKHAGTLNLGGLSNLPIEVFRELIKNKGQTMLGGIKLVTPEMAQALTHSTHTQSLWTAKVYSKKAAVILHEINKKNPGRVQIEDIYMQRVNAPFRPEIKWEEQ